MSIACELSNPNLKKTKAESSSSSVGKWMMIRSKKILLFRVLCGLVCVSALIWLCLTFSCICNKKEEESSSSSKGGVLFRNQNVSRSEIDAMLSLFFDSNQVTSFVCHKEFNNPGMLEDYGITCSLSTKEDEAKKTKRHVAELMSSSPENEESVHHHQLVVFFYVMNKWHWWWWLVLCVLVAGRMIFAFHRRKKEVSTFLQDKQQLQHQCKRSGRWSKNMLLLGIIAGVSLSVLWFWDTNEKILFQRKETLTNMCEERARVLQDQFNVSMNHVHALAILVSTFHHGKTPSAIDQKTFGEYTERTNFERPLTSGVAYALKVTHAEREKFEKEHGWSIKKMEIEDQTLVQGFDPAPVQDEYAPVIFAQETVSHIVSVDMMTGKEDRENILRARALGKGVLTSPFQLLKSNHLGVILTFAVYNTNLPHDATEEERINATIGYLGASYDIPSLVEKLLQQLASKQTISVNVYDTTNASSVIKMYGSEDGDMSEEHISSLDFGDPYRKHEMHCRFTQKPPIPWLAILPPGFALVITLLLGYIFNGAINRIATVEEDYQKMMELKARAEAADIAKSQFLATVSHEIRTPMVGVLGMLKLLMDTDLDAKQLDFAETAHGSGKDLISLINEVLDQAKIESGRLELENVPFDIRFLLDNVSSLLSGKAAEKGIELAVYVSSNVPAVIIGDPSRFRQIITNLVGNSIKFTQEKGHIFISVHLTSEVREPFETEDEILKQRLGSDDTSCNTLSGYPAVNAAGSWRNFKTFQDHSCDKKTELLVTVEDTGVGIPFDAQSRIFTPFMQADSSTSRTYGGTGIGLSISKRLVELMQGEIGFVSRPGIGTTFSFTGVFGERERDSSALELFHQSIQEFQGLKALVIDSRNIRAEVTRYHLQRVGVSSVDIASSLAAASSKLVNLDLVLIDKDAWNKEEYSDLLKEPSTTRPPKIILLATFTTPSELSEIKSSGLVDEVLMKPLRMSVLICCLQETMGSGCKKRQTNRKPKNLGNLLRGKKILVVDDTVVNRRVADAVLRKYGALVTCVDSGKAAVAMLKPPHDFDACFMDLQMPEMDGFEATRRVRDLEEEINKKAESSRKWHTPILAMTADVIQATNEKCIKCGMDGFVSKPFEEEELYSSVARFFDK
ncbi:Signal transduction response regulator [Hirschfeldia incana]|nr:Signal transduction response regulator [Hirschfeldia incana]